jgi:hypothetical protein
VADVCRQIGASETSFYLWNKKYAKLGMTELREENVRSKRLVADLTLGKHILGEVRGPIRSVSASSCCHAQSLLMAAARMCTRALAFSATVAATAGVSAATLDAENNAARAIAVAMRRIM